MREFICLHYALGNRTDDPYWIDARTALEVPGSLAENLELWKRSLPATIALPFKALFSDATYQAVLLGKRVYDTGYGDKAAIARRAPTDKQWTAYLAQVAKKTETVVKSLPDHRELLTHLRGDPPKGAFAHAQPAAASQSGRPAKTKHEPQLETASIL